MSRAPLAALAPGGGQVADEGDAVVADQHGLGGRRGGDAGVDRTAVDQDVAGERRGQAGAAIRAARVRMRRTAISKAARNGNRRAGMAGLETTLAVARELPTNAVIPDKEGFATTPNAAPRCYIPAMTQGFALFETPIGLCGLAWGEQGLVGAQLPEAAPGAAWDRLRRRYPDAVEAFPPPPEVQRTIERVNDLLAGGRDDLVDVELDFSIVAPFNRRVYEIARAIPPGETSTYGQIAKAMNEPGAARAIGKAWARTPGRSSCPAIACWAPTARAAASRPPAGSRPRRAC
jgi:methylated-DNA-[protein]-cysteine S-methyltransferase